MPARTQCTVCKHPEVEKIDKELVSGTISTKQLEKKYGLSDTALWRHQQAHLPGRLVKARNAREVLHGDDLLDQLTTIRDATVEVMDKARRARKHSLVLQAVARREKQIELEARLIGQLQDVTNLNVNVLATNDDWIRTRTVILAALEPYPDAKAAVIGALAEETYALRD